MDAGGVAMVSLREFAVTHQVTLTRFAYALCGDRHRAEDLVQDVLTSMFCRFGDAVPVAHPLAYARAAIVNAYAGRRRLRSSGELAMAQVPDVGRHIPGPDAGDSDAVWRALAQLSPRSRAVLVLRYYLDLPDADIADILGCRIGTVSSAASRALSTLRADPTLVPEGGR